MIRSAGIKDAHAISRLINGHASKGLMLPIALTQIYDQLRDFIVVEKDGRIVACGAIHVAWEDLGEIRSLAVEEEFRNQGLGKRIVVKLLNMAEELGLERVFVLTYQMKFFNKFNFEEVAKEVLPHKIWGACLHCPKFPNCDEVAMLLQAQNGEFKVLQ